MGLSTGNLGRLFLPSAQQGGLRFHLTSSKMLLRFFLLGVSKPQDIEGGGSNSVLPQELCEIGQAADGLWACFLSRNMGVGNRLSLQGGGSVHQLLLCLSSLLLPNSIQEGLATP